tara:strand:+ start:1666 stop:2055 length:390 start_codon:yes stop_codon:yes gene_type:complete
MAVNIGGLKQRAEFVRLTRRGRHQAMPGLVLQIAPSADPLTREDDAIRVGFTVSKRVGNAVQRNRLKRRLRAAVNLVFPACAAPGHDYVIVGRRAGLTRPFAELTNDLSRALHKTGCHRVDSGAAATKG